MSSDRHLPDGCATRPVTRFERGQRADDDDRLAEEIPVAMHFDGTSFAVMMATPADLEDFARGFALTEGKVDTVLDILDIDVREVLEGITVNVRTNGIHSGGENPVPDSCASDADPRPARELPGRSGCGICGSRELEDVVRHPAQPGRRAVPAT